MRSPPEVIGGQLNFVKNTAVAVASTATATAQPCLSAGYSFVKDHASGVASTVTATAQPCLSAGYSFVKDHASAVASTVTATAKPGLAARVGFVKGQAAAVASKGEGVGVGKAALAIEGAAVAAYFLWPTAAATAGATMNAPGAAGYVISHAAFLANPKLYFHLLRTKGAAAAAAVFA